jgi:hypothetical protein
VVLSARFVPRVIGPLFFGLELIYQIVERTAGVIQ